MKKRLAISIIALLFSAGLFSQTKDRALYRFDNEVLFLSEVKKQILELDKFRCLKPDWFSLKLTKLTKKDYPNLPNLPHSKKDLNEEKEFILRYLNLQKLKTFADGQLVKMDEKELEKINSSRCVKGGLSAWSQELKSLVKLEFYINSRYIKDSKDDKERQDRLESFLSSITKKSDNVLFF